MDKYDKSIQEELIMMIRDGVKIEFLSHFHIEINGVLTDFDTRLIIWRMENNGVAFWDNNILKLTSEWE